MQSAGNGQQQHACAYVRHAHALGRSEPLLTWLSFIHSSTAQASRKQVGRHADAVQACRQRGGKARAPERVREQEHSSKQAHGIC